MLAHGNVILFCISNRKVDMFWLICYEQSKMAYIANIALVEWIYVGVIEAVKCCDQDWRAGADPRPGQSCIIHPRMVCSFPV